MLQNIFLFLFHCTRRQQNAKWSLPWAIYSRPQSVHLCAENPNTITAVVLHPVASCRSDRRGQERTRRNCMCLRNRPPGPDPMCRLLSAFPLPAVFPLLHVPSSFLPRRSLAQWTRRSAINSELTSPKDERPRLHSCMHLIRSTNNGSSMPLPYFWLDHGSGAGIGWACY